VDLRVSAVNVFVTSWSDLGHVDLAGGLVRAGDHEQPAERDVLADHHGELGDLGIAEVRTQLRLERRVDRAEVGGELLGEADGERITRRQRPLCLGQMDLRDGRLVEPLPRRRRVPREESRVALVERRDFETRQLLDARGHHTVVVAGPEEVEVPRQEIRDQPRQIEAIVRDASAASVLRHPCVLASIEPQIVIGCNSSRTSRGSVSMLQRRHRPCLGCEQEFAYGAVAWRTTPFVRETATCHFASPPTSFGVGWRDAR
jgi:hypothetical protein